MSQKSYLHKPSAYYGHKKHCKQCIELFAVQAVAPLMRKGAGCRVSRQVFEKIMFELSNMTVGIYCLRKKKWAK